MRLTATMDITIPPHSLKKFTAAVTCLGKVGRDLYWSFDPMDGLTLSSLNEAKSAFCKFHFEPGFFQRCSAPQGAGNAAPGTASTAGSDDEDGCGCRYVCRVPVRSVHSILRRRGGVCQLRVRSEGQDGEGNHFGLSNRRRRDKSREDDPEGCDDYSDGEENNGRSSSRRRRKRRKQEKKKKARAQDESDRGTRSQAGDPNSMSSNTDKMMLSFEFFIERPQKAAEGDAATSNPSAGGGGGGGGGVFKVLHKVGVTDANGITLSASIHQSSRSEIFCKPKLWLRLLDPLRKTAEVALTIDDGLRVVTATSFHPGEIRQMAAAGGETGANAVLQAAAARNALLKTETSTSVEEFVEYDFRNNRGKKRKKRRGNGDGEEDDEEGAADESDRPPVDVDEKVILVFSIKEAKAMLQYCSQTSSNYDDDGVALTFHWGGRPICFEAEGDHFVGEMVLATLHHDSISSNITVGDGNRRMSREAGD